MQRYRALHGLLSWSVLFGGGWLWATPALAQCPNTIPNVGDYGTGSYSVKPLGGPCLPLTVNVKNTLPGSINVLTLFDYKGGPISPDSLKRDTLHTYTRPGKYTIVQFSEKDGRKLIACPTVYVYDTLPPSVRMVPCGSTQAKLIFDLDQSPRYDSHWISWGDGNILELPPHTQTVSHVYDTPPPHTISVWGTVNPGLCRSKDIFFRFDPSNSTVPPSIKSLIQQGSSSAELMVANPLKSELLLVKRSTTGLWESTGHIISKENEILTLSLSPLDVSCFQLQPTDTCLTEIYQSEIVCSGTLKLHSSDQAHEISWKTMEIPDQSKVSIQKDAVFWKDISQQGTSGTVIDLDLDCGREHCYQLLITGSSHHVASELICQPTPAAFCDLVAPYSIPDAFSPNGDGINDVFEIKGKVPSPFELTIFNSWGTVIFQTTDQQQPWNGTIQGTPLPAGTYFYNLIVGTSSLGSRHTRQGAVLVIK
jgi:gliding motility-associated-like protein